MQELREGIAATERLVQELAASHPDKPEGLLRRVLGWHSNSLPRAARLQPQLNPIRVIRGSQRRLRAAVYRLRAKYQTRLDSFDNNSLSLYVAA